MGATSMVRGGVTRYLPAGFRVIESSYGGCDMVNSSSSSSDRFGDVEFEFLHDIIGDISSSFPTNQHDSQSNQLMDFDHHHHHDEEEKEEEEGHANGTRDNNNADPEDNRTFWDNQNQVLQNNLWRTSSLETKIRNATKEVMQEIRRSEEEMVCSCSRQVAAGSCRYCLMTQVSNRLHTAGFNTALCKTRWRSSLNIPSGEHTFVDVIDTKTSKKGDVTRVIIEVNFRAEFEIGKASDEYNRLVRRLPEVFVGKAERLSNIVKVLCMAAKRCMKEKKMHMGPWRKHRYMQAKWLGPCERNTSTTSSLSMGSNNNNNSDQRMTKPKAKASMLTVDLLEKLPNMHYTTVEVV